MQYGEIDGTIAATAMLVMFSTLAQQGRPFGVVENVITLPQFRQRGAGRAVMRFLLEQAWRRSCYKVTLLTGTENVAAPKIYESLGFDGNLERGYKIYGPKGAIGN